MKIESGKRTLTVADPTRASAGRKSIPQPTNPMTLYQELVAAGCQIDNHESDLYVRVTPESRAIVERWCWIRKLYAGTTLFRSNTDGAMWWDVPFAYDPFWNDRFRN
jgi:hypothetical protein